MILALRHTLPPGAPLLHRASAAIIRARLVTDYAHAGILVDGVLHHATGAGGVHAEPGADLTGYTLVHLGYEHDERALALFGRVDGAGYDWVSLSAFVIPGATDSQRWYCFELAWLLMTSTAPRERVTGERLILQALAMGGRLMTPLPPLKAVAFST
jgi:hypothetical protein